VTCSVAAWVGARALREERKGAGVLLVKRAPESGVGVFDTNIELYNESGDGDGTWRAGGKEAWTCRHRTPTVRVQKAKIFHLSIGIFLALPYIRYEYSIDFSRVLTSFQAASLASIPSLVHSTV